MKQPTLLDFPKTHASRRERIDGFKAEHGIETYFSKGLSREEEPWNACHIESGKQMLRDYGEHDAANNFSLGGLVAYMGDQPEQAKIYTTGQTERDAIRKLCENLNIPWDL